MLMLLGVAVLAGCQSEPRIQPREGQTLEAAIDAAIKRAPRREVASATKARDAFVEAFIRHPHAELPAATAVVGMPLDEFIRFTTRTLGNVDNQVHAPAADPAAPDAVRNASVLRTLQLDKELLELARAQAYQDGLFTVDQFEWPKPAFVPPAEGALGVDDHATFVFTFVNRTDMDVYNPIFHLRVTLPSGEVVFDENLKGPDEKPNERTPITPGQPTLLQFTCCNIATAPLLNQVMHELPLGAQFDYTLVSIDDFTRRNKLDTKGFTSERYARYKAIDECIADMEGRLASWTPQSASAACRIERAAGDSPMSSRRR
ncbi:hypothetical protein [Rhodanobacter denitrificans]|uniref:hypothetical protein n=1 Tax=Rhodanobacter denitrificans TaxID=666685 RepID=UPI001F1F33A6|nr:hypothetical protein [Rhodanobacter denitrificans]UJJ60646.1 hypothetical protein LRK55_19630 [Rhodanobacter denitrificans]